MTTASKKRTGGHRLQPAPRGFATHQTASDNRPETNEGDHPPVLFRLPDFSDAQNEGLESRGGSELPPAGGSVPGEAVRYCNDRPTDQPPVPPFADFPPPPAVAPSPVVGGFPPPPMQPQTPPVGDSSEQAGAAIPADTDDERSSPAAATRLADRQNKSVRQSTVAAPAGRNWMETIGSRLLLLLLLAAVAAAAIFAGRGTDPADEIRLAGKPDDLLAELGIRSDGEPAPAPPTNEPAPGGASEGVVEPPLSYDEFIAQSEQEEQKQAALATDEKQPASASAEADADPPNVALSDLSLNDPNPANASADLRQRASQADRSEANETEPSTASGEATDDAMMPSSTATLVPQQDSEAEPHQNTDIAESGPRVADASTGDERTGRAITEPRSITEPRTNELFDSATGSTPAGSELEMPVNPYDQNPYAAERAPATSAGEDATLEDSSENGSSPTVNRETTGGSTSRYERTDMDQAVDWESLLPPAQRATGPPVPAEEREVPSTFEPQDRGLQPPINAPQQTQRDYAGGVFAPGGAMQQAPSQQGSAQQGPATDPRTFAGGQPTGGNQAYGRMPTHGEVPAYGGNQGYGRNQGYGGAYGSQAAQMPPGSPQGYSSSTNDAYPRPQAGGASSNGYGQPPVQQAVSPYDPPRR